jgi:protein involved in polysaccharide export with SLBB domain
MNSSHRGDRSIQNGCPETAFERDRFLLKSFRSKGLLLIFVSICLGLSAQQSQSPYSDSEQNPLSGMQNPNAPDCSDPLQANSLDCAPLLPGQNTTIPLQGMQPGMQQMGRYGAVPTVPNRNYTDLEQWNRQTYPWTQLRQPAPLPPEPLTEFQKFIASTTGQVLPIYGASLFRRIPSTFAPLEMTPVPPDFVIGPGDEIRIRVWGQLSIQANVRVDRSGEIYLPQVGPIHVASVPFSELDSHLRSAIGRVYHNFDLTADLGQIRSIQVYLAGAARRPGVYTVSSLSTLVDSLFVSGGPSTQGSLRRIELRRGTEKVTEFDLYNLLVRGDKSKDVKLLSGDVIYIPQVGPEAAVTGSVRVPAIYELLPGETLAQLLADAGGVSAVASKARVSIERIEEHQDRHAMEVSYDETGFATPISDGDLVRVFSIVPQYTKTVTLRGNIANPGRFAWHPGMHVSDLIPDKDSLVTRNYWWRRAQLGLPAPEFEPVLGFQNMRQPAENNAVTLPPPVFEQTNVPIQAQNPLSGAQAQPSTLQDQSGLQQLQPQEFSQFQPQQQAGNQQQQGRYLTAEQRGGSTSLAGQQPATPNMPPPTQRTAVRLLAPDIDWNYAVIERVDSQTLKTTLIPFDLGKLVLEHDASQDLELKSGDIVSIFSEADIRVPLTQQTKLVTLDGEFVHAGVYSAEPGETLRQLVSRAGGLTSKAYLYGSEFTRESTRTIQQARLDEYVQDLAMRIQRSSLALTAQDPSVGAAAQSSQRDLMSTLRQLRATGRIVLRFEPDSSDISSIPDIPMENGDRFVVPPVPAVVSVVGAVYDQNSFLYEPGHRVGRYLSQAGGPSKDADEKHAFVIRANGDVVSHDMAKGAWGNEFAKLTMNPGDTIVIPEKTFKPSTLRQVTAWSQLVSQFALGAAALAVIAP